MKKQSPLAVALQHATRCPACGNVQPPFGGSLPCAKCGVRDRKWIVPLPSPRASVFADDPRQEIDTVLNMTAEYVQVELRICGENHKVLLREGNLGLAQEAITHLDWRERLQLVGVFLLVQAEREG